MKSGIGTVLAGAVMAVLAITVSTAEPTQVERVQAAIDAWLAARAPIEKVTGIAAYISFGSAGPAIEAFSGKVGRKAFKSDWLSLGRSCIPAVLEGVCA